MIFDEMELARRLAAQADRAEQQLARHTVFTEDPVGARLEERAQRSGLSLPVPVAL